MPDSSRRYSNLEISRILRLATTPPNDSTGMTLEELVAVAGEAGLDPSRIREAAARLDNQVSFQKRDWLLGCSAYTELSRTVPGEVSPQNLDEVVAQLRTAFRGPTGSVEQLGKSTEWYGGGELTALQVALTPDSGQTRVKARLTAWAVPIATYGLVSFILGSGILVSLSRLMKANGGLSPQSLLTSLVVLLIALVASRLLVGSWYKSRIRQMTAAMDGVAKVLAEHEGTVTHAPVLVDEVRHVVLGSSDPA